MYLWTALQITERVFGIGQKDVSNYLDQYGTMNVVLLSQRLTITSLIMGGNWFCNPPCACRYQPICCQVNNLFGKDRICKISPTWLKYEQPKVLGHCSFTCCFCSAVTLKPGVQMNTRNLWFSERQQHRDLSRELVEWMAQHWSGGASALQSTISDLPLTQAQPFI